MSVGGERARKWVLLKILILLKLDLRVGIFLDFGLSLSLSWSREHDLMRGNTCVDPFFSFSGTLIVYFPFGNCDWTFDYMSLRKLNCGPNFAARSWESRHFCLLKAS